MFLKNRLLKPHLILLMKYCLHPLLLCLLPFYLLAQNDSITLKTDEYLMQADSINRTFQYEYGIVQIGNNVATLKVPDGYKYLNATQSRYVLTELWGNPPSEILGLLFPQDNDPLGIKPGYAVGITYQEEGYINDQNAKDIDYDELLDEMKRDTKTVNKEREKQGYPKIELIGWASTPYYDSDLKKLHWAKELKFEDSETNTLNYNIRILGRKGFINLNAVGDMAVMPQFKEDADKILASVEFNEGYRYDEFNPEFDKLAAYGIGGLIAGKVLSKVGIFALFAKFWKILLVGIVGIIALFKKRIFGSSI